MAPPRFFKRLFAPRAMLRIARWTVLVLLVVAALGWVALDRLLAEPAMRSLGPLGVKQQEFTQPDGRRLAVYGQAGSGSEPVMVLVHGTPGDAAAFRRQFQDGVLGVRLMSYDRPGFGGSPGGAAAANLDYQTRTLVKLVRDLGTGPVFLAGHSYGGPIALNAGLRAPALVRGVVLVAGSVTPEMERLLWFQRPLNWPWLAWLVPGPLRACNREVIALEPELAEMNRRLGGLSVPVLMLQGTKDGLVPPGNVPVLEEKLRRAGTAKFLTVRMFPGWTHFMLWEHAPEIDAAMATFVAARRGTLRSGD